MLSAKPTLDPNPSPSGPAGPRQARSAYSRQDGVASGHVFHASCRPHSWSLYGVHMRQAAGKLLRPARWGGATPAPAMQRDEAAATALVDAARLLAPQLGACRVWLWCGGRLPGRRFMTLLAGCASLRDVSRAHLGLEVSAQAIAAGGPDGRRQLEELRAAGIGVMLRLGVPQRQEAAAPALPRDAVSGEAPGRATGPAPDWGRLASGIERAHALGVSVLASGVWRREWAASLGNAGFAAVSGPAVCQPTDLDGVMKFIGPAESWLARMCAESV